MSVSTKCFMCLTPLAADSVHGYCAECVKEIRYQYPPTYTQSQLDAAVAEAKRACAEICEARRQKRENDRSYTEEEEVYRRGAESEAEDCRDRILATITEPLT